MVTQKDARALLEIAVAKAEKSGEEAVFKEYIGLAMAETAMHPDAFYDVSSYYQLYNTEKRLGLNLKKRAHARIGAAEIPAVTQLFTPQSLAEYIVENSLGRLLYECGIDLNCEYLDGVNEADFGKRKKDLSGIRILDPAAGSGNLLYAAARLMAKAYCKTGIPKAEIPALLAKNFVGLELDTRAAEVCRTLLRKAFGAEFEIEGLRSYREDELAALGRYKGVAEGLRHLSELGSVAVFPDSEAALFLAGPEAEQMVSAAKTVSHFTQKYDIILMNPPYLASSDCGEGLLAYMKRRFADCKTDLFAVFVARWLGALAADGYLGAVCPFNWMFTKQFGGLRRLVLQSRDIVNLAMLPANGYKEAVVYLSCFVLADSLTGRDGVYLKLGKEGASGLKRRIASERYVVNQSRFEDTPYNSLIFWTDAAFIGNYRKGRLSDVLEIRQGLATGDNAKFLRKRNEVPPELVAGDAESIEDFDRKGRLYAPYNKGGAYRKWYGNLDYVIRFDREAREELGKQGNRLPSRGYYFRPCLTWTLVSSKGYFGARQSGNSVFDVGGSCGFPKKPEDLEVILGYLCSAVATAYLNAQNPTINCQVGDIKNLPYVEPSPVQRARIERLVKENVALAREDWERTAPPDPKQAKEAFLRMKNNEEELNAIFIELYGLTHSLDPRVPDRLITLKHK